RQRLPRATAFPPPASPPMCPPAARRLAPAPPWSALGSPPHGAHPPTGRLGACPRINVIGALNPALAYRFARPAGSRPLTSPGLCKGMVALQHHGVLTRALSSPSQGL